MRVFFVHEDIYNAGNPYIYSLAEAIRNAYPKEFCFGYGRDAFWSEELFSYDIIHFQWPQSFIGSDNNHSVDDLQKRLCEIHTKGLKIFATCHDLKPHYEQFAEEADAMSVVYRSADVILHLGNYSKRLFEIEFPKAKHFLIPHHIYDTVYTCFPTREEACRVLGLNSCKKYILCFGTFRSDEERQLVINVAKKFRLKGCEILAPGFIDIPSYSRRFVWLPNHYERRVWTLKYIYGIHIKGITWNAVKDNELPYYYAITDVCLIQRKRILNSGNIFLPMLYDKVVVGPDVGNVGEILKSIEYPVFCPGKDESIIAAVNQGMSLAKKKFAQSKHSELMRMYSTSVIAKEVFLVYKEFSTN